MESRRVLHDRFGSVGVGSKNPEPQAHLDICGHRFPPCLLGCEIIFQEGQAPAIHHLDVHSAEDVAAIQKPDLETNHWARMFREQGKALLDRYGRVDATINVGGPINVATSAIGSEFFLYMVDSPPAARHFFDLITGLWIECYDKLTAPLSPDLDPGREICIGNCPVGMVSPEMYSTQILPADLDLRRNVRKLALHHCGVMDRYLPSYQKLGPLEYIEVGWGSNISAVRKAFPETILDLMINVYDVAAMSAADMRDVIADMVKQGRPASHIRDIWMADVGPDVPDRLVLDFVEAVDAAFGAAK
jgi:uroporphyrinogen-III decarboxylase